MVTITNYKQRTSEEGKTFYVLEVQGGLEYIQSKKGSFYLTAKRASVPSTFDEVTCKLLIGTKMPGSVRKEECEPYEYTIKESGETLELSHKYVYIQASENPNDLSESSIDSKGHLQIK